MPRGYPDYNTPSNNIGAVSFDIAELASRLGSLSRIDRLGNVILQEGFDNGLSGWKITQGVNTHVYCKTSPVYDGNAAVEFGVDIAAGFGASITKTLVMHDLSKIGLESVLGYSSSANPGVVFNIRLYSYSPTISGYFRLYLETDPGILYIYGHEEGGADDYIPILSGLGKLNSTTFDQHYHHIKLVIDNSTLQYVRLFFDHYSVSLSKYYGYSYLPSSLSGLSLQYYTGVGSPVGLCYLDNVILTMNEP